VPKTRLLERCEGYYRLENRRCDRAGTRDVKAADGDFYVVCEYHARQAWSASVARWHGESDVRAAAPAGLRPRVQPAA
jgi:hypothetical protein